MFSQLSFPKDSTPMDLLRTLSDRSRDHGKKMEVSQLAKIRSLIRKLNEGRYWLGKLFEESECKKDKSAEAYMDLEGDFLNTDEKLMLMTRSESRKDCDLIRLARKLTYLEPFHQYSQSIIRNLLKFSRIAGFEAGRVLFNAGDEPLGAYFILSGELQVSPSASTTPVEKFLETVHHGDLCGHLNDLKSAVIERGSLVGINEVLFGEPRPNKIIVTKNVLCIKFDKKYMMSAFLPMLKRWYQNFEYMAEYELFEHFGFEATRELSTIGKLKTYRAGSLIDATDTSYFLIEGQVCVIQRLLVESYFGNGKYNKRLYHDQDALKYGNHVESIFMKVGILNKGAYFGIGERMSKKKLWTTTACQVLYFSKDKLLKFGSPELWEAIRARHDAFYPSDSEILKYFQYGRDWLSYKKEVSSHCHRGRGLATIHDVPLPFRYRHMKVKPSFMRKVKMTEMPDYLLGGIDPLADVMGDKFVLDEGGPLREYMFGRLRTDPLAEFEAGKEINFDTCSGVEHDTFPSFFYYDALK